LTVSITHDTLLPQPPATVWAILTDSAAIEKWLMPNDFEARLGHRFTFTTQPIPAANFDGIIQCEVLEVDPPRRLAYSWTGGGLTTKVTYRLEAEGEGTHLYFEHSGFDLDNPIHKMAHYGMSSGWKHLWEENFLRVMNAQLAANAS
jgi:uncharacterized protein YndB with AHSA1/START domain